MAGRTFPFHFDLLFQIIMNHTRLIYAIWETCGSLHNKISQKNFREIFCCSLGHSIANGKDGLERMKQDKHYD